MLDKDHHLSRQEILLAAESELPLHRADEVQKHLSVCEGCRARMQAAQATIADFIRLHHLEHLDDLDQRLPAAAISRARLKAQLAEAAGRSRLNPWTQFFRLAFGGHGLAYVSAGLLVVALGTWALYHRNLQRESEPALANLDKLEPASVPNPNLTPGAVRPVTVEDVCKERRSEGVSAISVSQQQRVLKEYGMENARPENYELDYLITPELGGADDIRNLWPEPHFSTVWNSYVKDDLEDHLHELVCEGKLDLPTAQHDIATDWISAYKRYFQTDRPITNHSSQGSDDRRRPRT